MCIIVYKPMGIKMPPRKTLEQCMESNPDGAGFMWKRTDGKIQIEKGFFEFEDFWHMFKKLVKNARETDVVFHFRIATHGTVNFSNCHPFPITENVKFLQSHSVITPQAVAHNGIIPWCSPEKDEDLSDTMIFIRDVLHPIRRYVHNEKFKSLIERSTGWSKFALMDSEKVELIGDFIEDKGCYFSNGSYVTPRQTCKVWKTDYWKAWWEKEGDTVV